MKAIMLHDVRPFDKSFFPERYQQHSFITEVQFLNGLKEIATKIIDPLELVDKKISKRKNNGIILTFDDGLKDHLRVAEILASKKIKGVFFVPFGIIESNNFISSHLIQFMMASCDLVKLAEWLKLELVKDGYNEDVLKEFYISRWKKNVWKKEQVFITRILREIGSSDFRKGLLNKAIDFNFEYNLSNLHENIYLKKDDLYKIKDMGHIVGSHGWLSSDLRFENANVIRNELELPILDLKNFTKHDPWMSYANGGTNKAIQNVAKSLGYQFAFGTKHKSIKDLKKENLNLPRLDGTKIGVFVD